MIKMDEVFSWLNYNDHCHLSSTNMLSLIQIQDDRIPESHQAAAVKAIRAACEMCKDPLETLEIKVNLARIKFQAGDFYTARSDLLDVVDRYPPSSHRLGVAKWMLGMTSWKLLENDAAYVNWHSARETFKSNRRLQDQVHGEKSVAAAALARWYIEQINKMQIDLFQTAEESFNWLTIIKPSNLSAAANLLAAEIRDQIRSKQFPLAYEIGNRLAKLSRNRLDSLETAETWVIVGLAAYQMGVPRLAIDYWLRGVASFAPWSHEQAVTRWMIGIAQWQITTEQVNAMKNWREAIENFKDLKSTADQANNQPNKIWYEEIIPGLEQTLDQVIKEKSRPNA